MEPDVNGTFAPMAQTLCREDTVTVYGWKALAGMTEEQIRNAEPDALAKFLDAGRNVQEGDVRVALANALRRIADLTTRLERLEHAKSP
jgi:hypothetical protein